MAGKKQPVKTKMPEGRYDRQLGLPELASGGQDKLAAAHITVIGAGGLGSALLFSLVGVGVRKLRIVDHDTVSLSNLNRQFLYTPADIGRNKAIQAAARLKSYDPDLRLEVLTEKLDSTNSYQLIRDSDLVILCVDSNNVRYVVNEACCQMGIQYIDAAVEAFYGYISHIIPGRSACYMCQNGPQQEIMSIEESKIVNSQVIGTIPSVIGSMQAQLAVAVILGCSQVVPGSRYYYNGKDQSVDMIGHERDPDCLGCGHINKGEDGDIRK